MFECYISYNYGNIFIIVSSRPAIIGIDIDIIITFPPISTLFAIAVSPESLQILTANSVKNAIPVIFISNTIKLLFIDALLVSDVSKSIIADIFPNTIINIIAPANIDTYTTNSGLYCFNIIIIISATSPTPNNFYNIHFFLP